MNAKLIAILIAVFIVGYFAGNFLPYSSILKSTPASQGQDINAGASGILSLTRGQFLISNISNTSNLSPNVKSIYVMNSGNPQLAVILKPLLNREVELSGLVNSDSSGDMYVTSANGVQIPNSTIFKPSLYITNFPSLLQLLSNDQKNCVAQAVGGEENLQTLTKENFLIADLSTESLSKLASCLN